jgi:hypothetical protein
MGQFAAALEKMTNIGGVSQAHQTVKAPPRTVAAQHTVPAEHPAGVEEPKQSTVPPPQYNYPARQPVYAQPGTPAKMKKKGKSRIGLWIGLAGAAFIFCIVFAVIIYFATDLMSGQQTAAITSTAESLEKTIQANNQLKTQEAMGLTSTADALFVQQTSTALSAQQTAQSQDQTSTALAEEQNRNATSTAEAASFESTQSSMDTILNDFNNAENNWAVVYSNNFNDEGNWEIGEFDGEWWSGTKTVYSGIFRWYMEAHKGFTHFANEENTYYRNFLVSVECGQMSGAESGEVGLVFLRNEGDRYYFFINSDTGDYYLYLYSNSQWETLYAGISDEILSNTYNKISIKVENGVFTFFINGAFIFQFEHTQIQEGEVAITASLHNDGDIGAFEFDNLVIKTP